MFKFLGNFCHHLQLFRAVTTLNKIKLLDNEIQNKSFKMILKTQKMMQLIKLKVMKNACLD